MAPRVRGGDYRDGDAIDRSNRKATYERNEFPMTDERDPGTKKWIDEAEEALNRTAEALKAAWEGTREARMSTLEAAKDAANHLGETIDQGIAVAKGTWDPSRREEPTDSPAASEED